MGYYTDYDFTNNSREVIAAINEISGYEPEDGACYYSVKWYDHADHMKKVSLQFPDQVIHLQGVGEEHGDIWRAQFLNGKGKIQKANISFPDDEWEFE